MVAFTDQWAGEVNVDSCWRKERHPQDQETQTPAAGFAEAEMQTFLSMFHKQETLTEGVQTEGRPPAVPDPEIDASGDVSVAMFPNMKGGQDTDTDAMAKFLDGVIPEVSEMITSNAHAFAFEGYDVKWDAARTDVELLHSLAAPAVVQEDVDLQCVATVWNSTGSVVAAAYGRIDVVGWCKGSGYVCCWNVTRKEVQKPDVIIENTSHITSIAFHPTSPSLLLGGGYTGEVMMWDISAEQPLLGSTNVQSDDTHREPVVKVMWLLDRTARPADVNRFLMCSASGDGRVLFWKRKKHSETQFDQPLVGYVVKPRAAAVGHARRRTIEGIASDAAIQKSRDEVCNRIGLLSVGVMHSAAAVVEKQKCPSIDSKVIIGTENGEVLVTSVNPPKASAVAAATFDFKPLKVGLEVHSYTTHYGPVQACASSPFERNLFLTASSDGSAKLHNVLDSTLLTLEPGTSTEDYIYCAEFSPFRPCVMALGMRNSTLVLYDLQVYCPTHFVLLRFTRTRTRCHSQAP